MISRFELGKRILEEWSESSDGWIIDKSLEGVKVGNFAWKRHNGFMSMFPAFTKYRYEETTITLEEYLQRRKDGLKFMFETEDSQTSLPAKTHKKKQTRKAGLMNTIFGGNAYRSDKIKIPAIDLTITSIIDRSNLEKSLKLWSLDMTSSYIKEEQRKKGIPCLIIGIVKAAIPKDQANTMASAKTERRIEVNVTGPSADGSVTPNGNIVRETSEETKGYIQGPVLYKVLPLEVDSTGHIEAKGDSKGFVIRSKL